MEEQHISFEMQPNPTLPVSVLKEEWHKLKIMLRFLLMDLDVNTLKVNKLLSSLPYKRQQSRNYLLLG